MNNSISVKSRVLSVLLILGVSGSVSAQNQDRWFKIEVSIFTNEAPADRDEEQWQADRMELGYPDNLRRLDLLSDLLLVDDLIPSDPLRLEDPEPISEPAAQPTEEEIRAAKFSAIGPRPANPAGAFKFFDFLRDDYLQLPPSGSDFQQTNQSLERSAEHRLLFHGLWRQAVVGESQALPIYVQGGLAYGEQHELQGSLTIRFNDNADRVVVDANLWLTEFSIIEDTENSWPLPEIPSAVNTPDASQQPLNPDLVYHPIQVFHFQQSRDMRSTEFHYLDHPAMGLVILVEPYEVPALPEPEFDFDQDS